MIKKVVWIILLCLIPTGVGNIDEAWDHPSFTSKEQWVWFRDIQRKHGAVMVYNDEYAVRLNGEIIWLKKKERK
jgi:hypothetical protein